MTRVVSSCPLWKSSQIHEFVQLCQKQIETGRVHEQLQSEAPFLKIYFFIDICQSFLIPALLGGSQIITALLHLEKYPPTNHNAAIPVVGTYYDIII